MEFGSRLSKSYWAIDSVDADELEDESVDVDVVDVLVDCLSLFVAASVGNNAKSSSSLFHIFGFCFLGDFWNLTALEKAIFAKNGWCRLWAIS